MIQLIAQLVLGVVLAAGHGDHSFDLNDLSDAGMSYAERHVNPSYLIRLKLMISPLRRCIQNIISIPSILSLSSSYMT